MNKKYLIRTNILSFTHPVVWNGDDVDVFPSLKKLMRGSFSDIEEKLNGIYMLTAQEDFSSYYEPMAGMGFSTSVILQTKNIKTVYLNDINKNCFYSLCETFPNAHISQKDYLEVKAMAQCCFYDFSNFTFTQEKDMSRFGRISGSCNILIYTDVFPFSTKPFSSEKFGAYLKKMNLCMGKNEWYADSIYLYKNKNCMIVKASKNEKTISIFSRQDLKDPFTVQEYRKTLI